MALGRVHIEGLNVFQIGGAFLNPALKLLVQGGEALRLLFQQGFCPLFLGDVARDFGGTGYIPMSIFDRRNGERDIDQSPYAGPVN